MKSLASGLAFVACGVLIAGLAVSAVTTPKGPDPTMPGLNTTDSEIQYYFDHAD
jgi:hypothetical protein